MSSDAAPVTVAGGTYHETSRLPALTRLAGSGVRGAAILTGLGNQVTLQTALDDATAAEAGAVAQAGRFTLEPTPRGYPMTYRYSSPLSTPSATVPPQTSVQLDVHAERVVAYGMSEAAIRIEASRAVIDPQNGSPEQCGLTGSVNPDRCLILNHREARALTGRSELDSAGQDLLKQYGLAAVVIKHAVHGALVFTPGNDPTRTGVHPTTHVHPIGSGDAFTAGFAHAWFTGADPQAAAGAASRTAAAYCATGSPFHVADLLETVPVETIPGQGRLYLAGPFFSTAERWLIEHLRDALDALDVAVFSPLHDVGLGGDEVAARDLAGLDQATGVLAILDGHDCGTLFEIGWARARGLPVVALTLDPASAAYTMLRGTDCVLLDDLATAAYRASWAALAVTESDTGAPA